MCRFELGAVAVSPSASASAVEVKMKMKMEARMTTRLLNWPPVKVLECLL